MKHRLRTVAPVALIACVAHFWTAAPVMAETLTDALIKAYQLSPLIEANRAGLRATDEGVPQARAGQRPVISATASAAANASNRSNQDVSDSYRVSLDTSLNIYDSGQTRFAVEAAKALVSAGRSGLTGVEQQVLLDAVTAYVDVRRDQRFVALSQNNVSVLQQQVQAALDRFDVGAVTRTDVSLARARLAEARGNLASSSGQLLISNEQYQAVVGVPPVNLQAPPAIPSLPATLAEAEAIAINTSPDIISARFNEVAAEFDLKRSRAARGPSVSVGTSIEYGRGPTGFSGDRDETSASVSLSGNLPIYQGGTLSSLVRQAEALLARRKSETQNTARLVRQNVASAWANLEIARASIIASRQEVEAAQIAFDGVREEATLGARTTLDVLDREQELRDAQFQLVSDQRDEYVAAYALLSAMGLLTVDHLGLGIPTYNPDTNYQRVQSGPYTTTRGTVVDRIRERYERVD